MENKIQSDLNENNVIGSSKITTNIENVQDELVAKSNIDKSESTDDEKSNKKSVFSNKKRDNVQVCKGK